MSARSTIASIKRPLIGSIWMWIVGSFLSQGLIFAVAPQDYRNGWYVYMLFTAAYSAVGVFTFGLAALWTVNSYPSIFTRIATWHLGIPTAVVCGWFATVLLIVIAMTVIGDAHQLGQSLEWLLFSIFGSIYAVVGASYMLITRTK